MSPPPKRRAAEAAFVAAYDPDAFARPALAVDLVVFTALDALLRVLLVRRGEPPFEGRWALPGGFVRVGDGKHDQGEDLDAAAARELAEETGLPPGAAYLEQLAAFGRAGRDPRMRVVSVAYFALVRPTLAPLVRAGGDAGDARFVPLGEARALSLAFDHGDILRAAVARIRAEIDRGPLPFELVPETFTIPELRAVFDVVKGAPQDPGNFRKRVARLLDDGVIEQAPGKRITGAKPARVYRYRRPAGA